MGFPFSYWGANDYLLSADLDGLPVGTMSAAALLAATGLNYGQVAPTMPIGLGPSVQTSASTLVFVGAGANVVSIGDSGSGRGAVCQPRCRNFANVNDTRNINTTGWTVAVGSTYPYLTTAGPDGLFLSNRISGSNNNVSNYISFGSASPASRHFCASEWLRPTPGGSNLVQTATLRFNGGTPTLVAYGTTTPPATWQRVALALDSWDTAAFFPLDGTTEVGNGGIGAGARDMLFDCMQIDGNDFASEYLDGGNANVIRQNDRFFWPGGSGFVAADGSISFYTRFVAKHATTNKPYIDASTFAGQSIQPYQYLCWLGTSPETAYLRINVGTGTAWRLEAYHSTDGAAVVSSSSIAWAKDDIVEVFVKFGGGVATIAKWRVGLSGSWNLFGLTSTFSAILPGSNPLSVNGGDSGAGNDPHSNLWCRLQKARIYKSGRVPAGV